MFNFMGAISMDDNQKAAFETLTITVAITTAFLSVMVGFIFWIQSGVEETRLKHETCMVVTKTSMDGDVVVTEYCGSNKKAVE